MDSAETPRRRRTVDDHAVGPRPLPSARQPPTPGHPAPFPGRDYRRRRQRGGTAHSCVASVKRLLGSPDCYQDGVQEDVGQCALSGLASPSMGGRFTCSEAATVFPVASRPTTARPASWSAQLRLGGGGGVRCLPLVAATVDVSTRLRYRS